jgi:hypothetical protein
VFNRLEQNRLRPGQTLADPQACRGSKRHVGAVHGVEGAIDQGHPDIDDGIAEWSLLHAGLDRTKMFPRRLLRSRHRGVIVRCHLVIILNTTGFKIMATGIRSPFDPFISHRSALASCLAVALLLPAAALAAPPPAPVPSPGFTITTFAGPLAGSTAPDSIAVVGKHVWVGYGNGGSPDGSGGR